MQMLQKEAETDNHFHFSHFHEFNATIDIDFHYRLDFGEAKKDLLDYLENLTRNMNSRFKSRVFRFCTISI